MSPSLKLFFGGALLANLLLTAPSQAQQTKPSVRVKSGHSHGGSMPVGHHEFRVVAGDGKFFLSHFPRLSSIHAFQFIVEVTFDAAVTAAMEKDAREDVKRERRYQLEPFKKDSASVNRGEDEDDWVLPDTLQSGKSFTGDVFYFVEGERRIVARNISVTVKGIVWKAELNPNFPRPKELTYLLFGSPKAAFLAHEITAPKNPGGKETEFDQVVSAEIVTATEELTPTSVGKRVVVRGVENIVTNRLQPGQRIKLVQPDNTEQAIEIIVRDELQLRQQIPTQR